MKKSEKPKIKITGTAKAVPVPPKKTFKPGSMVTSSKNVTVKPAAPAKKKSMSPALKSKVEKALAGSRVAKGTLSMVKEAKKLGNLQGPGVAAKKIKEANQSVLDRGKTAARAANILSKAKKK
jgi:hypothetical protein